MQNLFGLFVDSRDQSSLYFSKLIWHHVIPLKWSLIAWIAVNGRLPMDDVIQRRGIQLASQCNCCSSPMQESISCVCFKQVSSNCLEPF